MAEPIPFPAKRRRRRRTTKIPLETGLNGTTPIISLRRASDHHAFLWIGDDGDGRFRCFGTLAERGMRQLRQAIDDALALREERLAALAARRRSTR